MKTYTFYTKDSTRIDVEATSPKSAWNKLKSLPHYKGHFTGSYGIYDKDGLMITGIIHGRIEKDNFMYNNGN